MDLSTEKLKSTLQQSRYSATTPRIEIFQTLTKNSPITLSNLCEKLNGKVDRATVYRTIDLFEKLGIVNKIWHGFKYQIEPSEIFTPHHHHALCLSCDRTIPITSTDLEVALSAITRKQDFIAVSHSVEIIGHCQDCSSK